jgi:1-acyl-sn-glycerol-3-phosphate acyltransferase
MPRPLAYVFKKELLQIPFFGWSIGSLDMIHIDRKHGSRAFHKVVEQGKRLLEKGYGSSCSPREPRGARRSGEYKTGATRLAIMAGKPGGTGGGDVGQMLAAQGLHQDPGVVDVSIGKPIPTVGRKHDELMAEVQAWIEAEMRRLDPEAYPAVPAPLPAPAQG